MLKDRFVESEDGPPPEPSLSPSLLVRLKGRDPEAWCRLSTLYGPEVYRWCRRAGLSPEDARDVGQEVFRAVAAKLDDFRRDGPGDSFRGWVWTITQNKVRDHWRRRADEPAAIGGSDLQQRLAQVPAESDVTVTEVGGETTRGFMQRALELVRDEFEERTWRAFWRVVVEEHTVADVARDLQMKPNAVYIAKSRVLNRLRAELGEVLS